MTYKLEPGLSRITSPIILIFPGGEKTEYRNGEAAYAAVFDRKWKVAEIAAKENKIEISLEESDEPDQSFF